MALGSKGLSFGSVFRKGKASDRRMFRVENRSVVQIKSECRRQSAERVRVLGLILTLLAGTVGWWQATGGAQRARNVEELLDFTHLSYFAFRDLMYQEALTRIKEDAHALALMQPAENRLKLLIFFVEGESARLRRDFKSAEDNFTQAAKVGAPSLLPIFALAETAVDRGETSKATAFLSAATYSCPKLLPGDLQHLCFTRIGELYEKSGKYTEAIDAYGTAVNKKPNWAAGRRKLAETYLSVNKPQEALRHLQKAVVVEPKSALNYVLLGEAHSSLGNSKLALQSFQKAVDLDLGNPLYHYRLGLEYERRRTRLAAFREYSTALNLAEKDRRFSELVAKLREAIGRCEK